MSGFRTLADIADVEKTPLAAQGLVNSTYDLLRQGTAINPDATALIFFLQGTAYAQTTQFTYRQMLGRVHQAANLFAGLGIGPMDVVSLVLPNLPEMLFSLWGAEIAGIVNPINPLLEPQVIAEIMEAAGTKVLVTLAPFPRTDIWQKVATILGKVPTLQAVVRIDLAHYLHGVQRLAVGLMRHEPRPSLGNLKVLDYHATARRYPSNNLAFTRTIQPSDIASYFHTGGTTGTPKLARHTHRNEVFDAWSASRGLEVRAGEVIFAGLPLFHVNGYLVTGLIPWSGGGTIVLGTPAGYRGAGVIQNFWKIVERYKINYFSSVPTVYSSLLNVPIGQSDIRSLQFALCGAAPMPIEVFQEFERRTGVRILEGYGLTEGTCVSAVNPAEGERRVGSIGFSLPYQEMKILDIAPGHQPQECPVDAIGVVAIRGPNVFAGYKEERHNLDIWIDMGDGGEPWLNTGDLGRRDADGYFWLTGRKKELIIRGGHNIDPQAIEGPLYEHPAVALVAAVGRPDPRVGEVPVAYIELKPGATATEAELLQFAEQHIGERAAYPKQVHIISGLPLTAVGKIFKPGLVMREVRDVFTGEVHTCAGVQSVTVEVANDQRYGLVAHVRVTASPGTDTAALRDQIDRALGQYVIRAEVTVA